MTDPKRHQGQQKPIGVREAAHMRFSPSHVANAVRAHRVTLGLTRAELGRQLGCDAETIRNWENGKAPLIACRVFSWLFEDNGAEELWRERALLAEAALRDMTSSLLTYREVSNTRNEIDGSDGSS